MKDNSEMTKEELIALGWIKKPSDKMQEKTEKLTAVEWFANEINGVDTAVSYHYFKEKVEQAKEMEKEQIVNAWNNGFEENRPYVDHSEDYYNETFKSE